MRAFEKRKEIPRTESPVEDGEISEHLRSENVECSLHRIVVGSGLECLEESLEEKASRSIEVVG